jgi:hypothetical protein
VSLGLRVAYHEAGHALAAHFLGRRVESVSIGPGGGGALRQEPLAAEATDEEIKQGLVVVFAGPEAERYAPAEERDDDEPWLTPQEMAVLDAEPVALGEPTDEDVIDHFTKRLGAEEVDDARAFAAEIVERQYRAGRLEQLADELLWRTSLAGDDIERLLGVSRV